MAYRTKRTSKRTSKKNNAKRLKKLAYDMGRVERGLKNPDSQISASFNAGKKQPAKRTKKTLY